MVTSATNGVEMANPSHPPPAWSEAESVPIEPFIMWIKPVDEKSNMNDPNIRRGGNLSPAAVLKSLNER